MEIRLLTLKFTFFAFRTKFCEFCLIHAFEICGVMAFAFQCKIGVLFFFAMGQSGTPILLSSHLELCVPSSFQQSAAPAAAFEF